MILLVVRQCFRPLRHPTVGSSSPCADSGRLCLTVVDGRFWRDGPPQNLPNPRRCPAIHHHPRQFGRAITNSGVRGFLQIPIAHQRFQPPHNIPRFRPSRFARRLPVQVLAYPTVCPSGLASAPPQHDRPVECVAPWLTFISTIAPKQSLIQGGRNLPPHAL